ncbi:MAG: glutamine amidotransferase [Myxococcota bacterium]|nr:glutamine amidotransferase [Myxococcota bacterium]
MPETRLLIVKTGSAEPEIRARRGDFEDWISDGMGVARAAVQVVDVREGGRLPDPDAVRGVVVTGSSAFVSERESWSTAAEAWLRPVVAAGTPVLGICYGHQLLAQALGGCVGRNPLGREMGTVEVDLAAAIRAEDPLLGHLPQTAVVQATHVESVLDLPDGAIRLGTNAADENHAFRCGRRAWGVQFHPEFDADVMRSYVELRADVLREEGLDPDRFARETRDSSDGPAVLRRFGDIVRGS